MATKAVLHRVSMIRAEIDAWCTDMAVKRDQARRILDQIVVEDKRDVTSERNALKNSLDKAVSDAQNAYDQHKASGGMFSLLDNTAKKALAAAASNRTSTLEAYDIPEERSARAQEIEAHNAAVDAAKQQKEAQASRVSALTRNADALEKMRDVLASPLVAVEQDAWLGSNFLELIKAILEALQARDYKAAAQATTALRYQRKPSMDQYRAFTQESLGFVAKAYSKHHGYPAVASRPKIVEQSLEIRKSVLTKRGALSGAKLRSSDRWQRTLNITTDPLRFQSDVMWVFHWTFFQLAESFSGALTRNQDLEDTRTGQLFGKLDGQLMEWCHLSTARFGYPAKRSLMGRFSMAGKNGEERLGSDFALLVDIDVGPVRCRKVAIFQAKKTLDGIADLGTDDTQLKLLSSKPGLAYYLFYPESKYGLDQPSVTVCESERIGALVSDGNGGYDTTQLRSVDVWDEGYELATFLVSGLFNQSSTIGRSFDSIHDGLLLIGDQEIGTLPDRCMLFAISDKDAVSELHLALKTRYLPLEVVAHKRDKTRGIIFDDELSIEFYGNEPEIISSRDASRDKGLDR